MLPKNKRLTSGIQKEIFEKGKSIFGQVASMVYIKTDPTLPTRFGFSISKKVANTAPKRNVIKRRGYESIKRVGNNLNRGYCVVFIIKKDISKEPIGFFTTTILELVKKSPLYTN